MRDFAWALDELRSGERVQRSGWNSRGQFVTLQAGYPNGIAINTNTADAIREAEGSIQRFQPYFMLRSADGSFVPWAPTTADCLAEDWQRFAPRAGVLLAAEGELRDEGGPEIEDENLSDPRHEKVLREDSQRHEKALAEDDRRGGP